MLILGFDTSTDICTVALNRDDELLLEESLDAPREHMRILLPLIDSMLARCDLDIMDVEAIAVGLGPGSFTGLRIGVSVAKGLAIGLGLGIVGVSSLDIIAAGIDPFQGLILVATDAKRKEIYTALYANTSGCLKRLSEYEAVSPDDLLSRIQGAKEASDILIVGDALKPHGHLYEGLSGAEISPKEKWSPKAGNLNRLTHIRIREGSVQDPLTISPIYVRIPIAEEAQKRD